MTAHRADAAYRSVFDGAAFHSDYPQGRVVGRVEVRRGAVVFVPGDGDGVALPLRGLRVKLGGAADRLVFFTHPTHADWSVYTSDRAILGCAELRDHPDTGPRVAKIRSGRRWFRLLLGAVLVVLVAVVGVVIASRRAIVRAAAQRVPVAWETELGDAVFAQLVQTSPVIEAPAVDRQIAFLTRRLVRALPDRDYQFRFHVIEDPAVNAFALPGGNVVINSGLLLRAQTAPEVLGVLAHEAAHVTQRHSIRQLISTAGMVVILQAALGDTSGLLAVLNDGSRFLLQRKFSRDFEREADEVAVATLLKARIDPHGLVTFFDRLRQDTEDGALPAPPPLLSTHPALDERIAVLRKKLDGDLKSVEFEPVQFDFPALQATVRAALGQTKNDHQGGDRHGSDD